MQRLKGISLFDLNGKVAIVTGAGRGLGHDMAAALAHAGADLVLTGRHKETLEETASEINKIGSKALPLVMDVRDIASINSMVEKAEAHFGHIDILVNNAGCNVRKPAIEVQEDDWDLVVDTILKGAFFTATAAAKKMIPRKWGRIINIGSVCCVAGYAGITPYCAARGGIKQMTMSLADDWGDHGITVNCLAPGWFQTHQTKILYENKQWVDDLLKRIPLRRTGESGDLDGTVIYLASEASSYVTGQTILVDGGISIGATPATGGNS